MMTTPVSTAPFAAQTQSLAALVPLGAINDLAADVVAGNLQAILDLPTDILPAQHLAESAYMRDRRQYDAVRLINNLAGLQSIDAPVCVGLTSMDIGTPILTYVYGESQLGGRVAVVSFYRLTTAGREMTLARLSKLSLHEVGHVLGLGHCWEHSCLMRSIRNIEQLDALNMSFCESCRYELDRRVRQLKTACDGQSER